MEAKSDPSSRIIAAAVQVIDEATSPAEITVRRIVALAEVNLNAINYHFGSKESLIREAVRVIIGRYFQARNIQPGSTGPSVYAHLARICDFLFAEPVAARLALEAELGMQGSGTSLTSETMDFFVGLLKSSAPGGEDGELRRRVWMLLASVHQLVLRPAGCREWLGFDPFEKGARDAFLAYACATLGVPGRKGQPDCP